VWMDWRSRGAGVEMDWRSPRLDGLVVTCGWTGGDVELGLRWTGGHVELGLMALWRLAVMCRVDGLVVTMCRWG